MTTVINLIGMSDVGKNVNPDRLLCGPESFTRRVSESFTRRESEKEEDLAGNVGENVAGWGHGPSGAPGQNFKAVTVNQRL